MSISKTSVPVFEIGLNALSTILDKAEAYAYPQAKAIEPAALLGERLAPDMFNLGPKRPGSQKCVSLAARPRMIRMERYAERIRRKVSNQSRKC
jgi:hypothetical protein